jgi:glycine cleavage system H protein
VSGNVLEVNVDLADDPEKINKDPYGDGWIVRLQPSDDGAETLTPNDYQALLDELDA